MDRESIIKKLSLEKHIEGGYFKETFRSEDSTDTQREGVKRNILTSIYYMLTSDSRIGHFHVNKSDIVHYFHLGSPLTYMIIHPDGKYEDIVLGSNIDAGHVPQLVVKGGCYKATVLKDGDFGLIGEAVAPGFDYRDMKIADAGEMKAKFPDLYDRIQEFIRK